MFVCCPDLPLKLDKTDLTITLSKAGTAQDNLRGNIKWAKPSPRQGQSQDVVNIAPPAA